MTDWTGCFVIGDLELVIPWSLVGHCGSLGIFATCRGNNHERTLDHRPDADPQRGRHDAAASTGAAAVCADSRAGWIDVHRASRHARGSAGSVPGDRGFPAGLRLSVATEPLAGHAGRRLALSIA